MLALCGSGDFKEMVTVKASKAATTATALLSRIARVSQDDRLRIESKAAELRSRLERVPVYGAVRAFLASVAS